LRINVLRFVQSHVTELNLTEPTRFIFEKKLTIGQAEQAHWSLVDAYVSVVTQATDAVRQCLL